MNEVLAFWNNDICCIAVDHSHLRGTSLTIVSEGYKREEKEVHYDSDKKPYIIHKRERLMFCDKEREKLGI